MSTTGVPNGGAALDGLSYVEADDAAVGGNQAVGPQQPPIPDPVDGFNMGVKRRDAAQMKIAVLRAHGLIVTIEP